MHIYTSIDVHSSLLHPVGFRDFSYMYAIIILRTGRINRIVPHLYYNRGMEKVLMAHPVHDDWSALDIESDTA